jgi:hypothetical protein
MRRALVGLLCGAASSIFLSSAVRSVGLGLCLGSLLGIGQVFAFFDLASGSAIDRAMTCAAFGLPSWATINLILLPIAAGQEPKWTAGDMRSLFPELIGWLLFFLFLGPVSGGSPAQPTLSRSRVTVPRAFRTDEDNTGSDSWRRLCRGNDCGTS